MRELKVKEGRQREGEKRGSAVREGRAKRQEEGGREGGKADGLEEVRNGGWKGGARRGGEGRKRAEGEEEEGESGRAARGRRRREGQWRSRAECGLDKAREKETGHRYVSSGERERLRRSLRNRNLIEWKRCVERDIRKGRLANVS